jgi:4-amino-4-deoxy-L-arabinose transferase-like glycosyltransferase
MNQGETRTLPAGATALLLALCAALLLYRLGAVPILGPDEPRYARVAIEMSRSGDLVTPRLQGVPWLEKPILYYWLAAGAFALFGENEAAARLPAVGAMLLMVAVTALLGARLYGRRSGLHAGFITATALLPFAYGRAATMDVLLAATVTAGLALLALRRFGIAGPSAAWVGAAFLGLATLAKGPLGLLLPILALVPHALLTRARPGPRLVTLGSALAFAMVALPWYALVFAAEGRHFVDTFFLNHNVQRFTSQVHNHPGPFFYYVPVLLAGLFPWSGLVLPAIGRFSRRVPADVLIATWILVPLAFFSAAGSKLPGYILPVIPPLAILMGRGAVSLVDAEPLRQGFGARAAARVGLVLGCVLLAAPWLARLGDPTLTHLLMLPAFGGGLMMLLAAWALGRAPVEGLRVLRLGAAGFLLLLATVAPPLLAARESGRDLFRAASGREVLVWNAWRTAWMSGYFYNDARVREVAGADVIFAAANPGPVLVLCGPGERQRLDAIPALDVKVIAIGPRRNALLEVQQRKN